MGTTHKNRGPKKGLSTVIATLLIILLVLIAVAIIWAVVSRTIEKSNEQIDLGKVTLSLEIKKAIAINESFVKVYVKRNPGVGKLVGLSFIFKGDGRSEVIERNLTLEELHEDVFIISLGKVNVHEIKSISIAPILELRTGKNATGNINDEYTISASGLGCEATCDTVNVQCGTQVFCGKWTNCGSCESGFHCPNGTCIANIYPWEEGLISWWDFNVDSNDSRGNNPGIVYGATLDPNGKSGGLPCYYFDGINDYIDLGTFSIPGDKITLAAWVMADGDEWTLDPTIISKANGTKFGDHTFLLGLNNSDTNPARANFDFEIISGGSPGVVNAGNFNFNSGWHFMVYVYNSTHMSVYFDNVLVSRVPKTGNLLENSNRVNIGRNPVGDEEGYRYWHGRIDEPMIWNRALTEDEISELYNLFL